MKNQFNIDLTDQVEHEVFPNKYPQPNISDVAVYIFKNLHIDHSFYGLDRLIRSHGHSLQEIVKIKLGMISRIPDIVAWPSEYI